MQSFADRGLYPALQERTRKPLRGGALVPFALGVGCTGATLLLWRELVAERTASGLSSPFPESVLISGLLVSWLLALSIWLLHLARARTRAEVEMRRELEAQMAERTQAEERYRTLFERNPAGMYRSTVDGRLLDCNDAFVRMFGYPDRDTLLGQPVAALYCDPADRARLLDLFFQGESPQNVEVQLRRYDGEPFWGLLRGPGGAVRPYRDSDGSAMIEGAILDITDRKRAEEALRERERDLVLLGELGGLLQTCDSVQESYVVMSRQGRKLFPQMDGAVFLISPSRTDLDLVASWGSAPAPAGEGLFRPEDCWALRLGREHFVSDPSRDLVCRHLGTVPSAASLCLPLVALGETLGVLVLRAGEGSGEVEGLGRPRRQLATAVSEQLAMSVANLRLRETLRHQSIRDALTGLYNRRFFQDSLEREIRRVRRRGATLGLLMIDIDDFKVYNDTYGHEAGDLLLRLLGDLLRRRVRSEDIACRYGGEEFALILPEATLETTQVRAEELREEVKRLRPVYQDGPLGGITVSIGVAAYPEHGPQGEDIVRAADTALYNSKAYGRDCISLAPVPPPDRRVMIPE